MTKGIKISTGDISSSKDTELTLDTTFLGGMKVHQTYTFQRGGTNTLMSSTFGLSAKIQKTAHELGYAPAYMAFRIFGTPTAPTLITLAYSDYISVLDDTDFVQVDKDNVIVGFAGSGCDYIRVIVFAEKLD